MGMTPSRSEFRAISGRRYHVRVWGDDAAPTLFFLHGWGDSSASFQFVVDALGDNYRVVAPDWRGFGLSQWNDGAYFFADYLADLDGLLERYSPVDPAMIVAHSLGGIIAALYAGVRPERVAALANLEGFGLWVLPPEAAPERIEKWLQQRREGDAAFRRYATRAAFATQQQKDNPRLSAERAAFLAENALRQSDDGRAFVFAADPKHRWPSPLLFPLTEAEACWRRTRAPTLWISGRNSLLAQEFFADAENRRRRAGFFARLAEEVVDDCGHNLHHDQPERLARLLTRFFAPLLDRRSGVR